MKNPFLIIVKHNMKKKDEKQELKKNIQKNINIEVAKKRKRTCANECTKNTHLS